MTGDAAVTLLGRRALLALLAGAGLGLAAGCSTGPEAGSAGPEAGPDPVACPSPGPAVPDGVRVVGRRYRAIHPDDELDLAIDLASLPDDAAVAALGDAVAADFAAGRIVVVDGWVLARTEARAAALLSAC